MAETQAISTFQHKLKERSGDPILKEWGLRCEDLMKFQINLCFFLILIWVVTGLGCSEDSSSPSVEAGEESEQTLDLKERKDPKSGTVSGIITDTRTGKPIPGVTVSLLDQKVETGADGRYVFTTIRYADTHKLNVMSIDYQPKMKPFKLRTEQVQLDISLVPKFGAISGVITDSATGKPIPGVTVNLLDRSMTTEEDGRYNFTGVPYSENLILMITVTDYQPKMEKFQLRTGRIGLNIPLVISTDPKMEIIEFLERFSALIEGLDIDQLELIQALFSETYLAADDPVTLLGLATGVIPAKFDDVVPTITKVFEKYNALQFQFNEIQVDVTNSRQASARLALHIISEQGPRPNKREIIVDCQINFRKENSMWQIVFWQLFNVEFLL